MRSMIRLISAPTRRSTGRLRAISLPRVVRCRRLLLQDLFRSRAGYCRKLPATAITKSAAAATAP